MACLLTISPEFSGHLYPAVALQVELRARGHDVRMIGREGGEIIPQQQGVPYEIVDTELFSRSRIEEFINCIGNRDFSESFNASREFHLETAKAYVRSLPTILERIAPDLLIVDQTLLCVGAIADVVDVPYVNLSTAMNLVPNLAIPPPYTTWKFRQDLISKVRNLVGYYAYMFRFYKYGQVLSKYRKSKGNKPYLRLDDGHSKRLILTQSVDQFEFPIRHPTHVHNVGPLIFREAIEKKVDFPYDLIDRKEFVYVSFGSMLGGLEDVLVAIAEACTQEGLIGVIVGGKSAARLTKHVSSEHIVVEFAPQITLLQQARLLICHAGMNTTMEGLKFGVPIIAIPFTNDQPGIAVRIEQSGCGKMIPFNKFSRVSILNAIREVKTPRYQARAEQMKEQIEAAGGTVRAADLIEEQLKFI